MITCVSDCLHQSDGICRLDYAGRFGTLGSNCIHYVPTDKNKHRELEKNNVDKEKLQK